MLTGYSETQLVAMGQAHEGALPPFSTTDVYFLTHPNSLKLGPL